MSTKSNFSVFGRSAPGPLHGIEFGSFTYIVGKLTLQLLAPRWKHISQRGSPVISLTPDVYWEQAATLFWPHDGGSLSWPPPKHLADDTIQMFVERFGRYILPIRATNGQSDILLTPNNPQSKYAKYQEAWHLLKR
jgi:hypothetical protein